MSGEPNTFRGRGIRWRRIRWGVAFAALAWLAFAPTRIGPAIARQALLASLNAPERGLSCREAEVAFGWWDLVRHLRVSRLELRGLSVALREGAAGALTNLVGRQVATFDVRVAARPHDGHRVTAVGSVLGAPFSAAGDVAAAWSTNLVEATGRVRLEVGAPREDAAPRCGADVAFAATPAEWSANASVPAFGLSEADPDVARLLAGLAPGIASNLTFRARVAAEARAERTRRLPVVAWRAKATVRDGAAALRTEERTLKAEGLSATLAAEGIADRVQLKPVRLRARELACAGVRLEDFHASVSKDEDLFFVTEAGAGFCGGTVGLYALYLDAARLNAGFTLFLDDIDAGLLLAHLPCFRGEATGRLHGKLPLSLREGRRLRFRNAFLYSTPGERGNLRLADATPLVGNLEAGGVPPETCGNLAKALKNLDYDVLRLKFARGDGEDGALSVKVAGASSVAGTPVPVDFEVTFHGALEQLLNFGLGAAQGNLGPGGGTPGEDVRGGRRVREGFRK